MRLKTPKKLKPIYKQDGEVLTAEDLRFLYVESPDRLSFANISTLFDVEPLQIYYFALKNKISPRKEDNYLYSLALIAQKAEDKKRERKYAAKRFREEAEKNRLLWEEALMLYGKPRPTQTYVVKGRERLDKGIQKAYFKNVTEIFNELKYPPKKQRPINRIRQVDLSAMRLHRGLDMFAFSKQSGLPYKTVVYYEKTANIIIPEEISNVYLKVLNISKTEFKRILEILAGKRNSMFQEDSRSIPESVREYVWKRDMGKCRSCGVEEYLHYHHVRRYTDGGKHEARNLKLLCVSCHAEAHFGEPGYQLLKSQVIKLLGVSK